MGNIHRRVGNGTAGGGGVDAQRGQKVRNVNKATAGRSDEMRGEGKREGEREKERNPKVGRDGVSV